MHTYTHTHTHTHSVTHTHTHTGGWGRVGEGGPAAIYDVAEEMVKALSAANVKVPVCVFICSSIRMSLHACLYMYVFICMNPVYTP